MRAKRRRSWSRAAPRRTCTNAPKKAAPARSPPAARPTIPEYGTGALGYRSPISDSFTPGQPDALFGTTGYLLVSVNVAARNPATNVAPVSARLIPLVQSLSLDPVDGTLLRRSAPALFQGLGRRPIAGDRWGPISASSGNPDSTRRRSLQRVPADAVPAVRLLQPRSNRNTRSPPPNRKSRTSSSRTPNSTNLRKPLQNAEGHVIPDPKSGILCAFNAGTTSSRSPLAACPTRCPSRSSAAASSSPAAPCRSAASRFAKPAAAADPAAPDAAAALRPRRLPRRSRRRRRRRRSGRAARQARRQATAAARGAAVHAAARRCPRAAVPAIPPPPAAAFARPIPPGGATVRVFEEKKEEEEATEQSQAFAAIAPRTTAACRSARAPTRAGAGEVARSRRASMRCWPRCSWPAPAPRSAAIPGVAAAAPRPSWRSRQRARESLPPSTTTVFTAAPPTAQGGEYEIRERISRHTGTVALAISMLALIGSGTGLAEAARRAVAQVAAIVTD